MTPPTLPPEAVIAAYNAPSCGGSPGSTARNGVCGEYGCEACLKAILAAAYPHLRRAILAEAVPQIVEMAREDNYPEKVTWQDWKHTPALILAALEKGEHHQPGGTNDRG